ncbi:MAG TPA: SDR family oxidoreductase [Alphaproteobacteria bacterium]
MRQFHGTRPGLVGRLFVFGLGYSATVLARRLKVQGWIVGGTVQGEDRQAALVAEGLNAVVFDGERPLSDFDTALARATHILISVPPGAEGDRVLARHATDIAALKGIKWIGYLSTTGVYGDTDGAWVDERAGLHPTGPRGRARVAAERAWLDLGRLGLPVHVFRLAGIYGPGRSALDAVRAGTARRIVKPGQVFSRIHVEDIASVLAASMAQPNPGAVYNVCDDEAAPPQDVIAYAAALLGMPAPPEIPFAEAAKSMSEMARSFYDDNRRVANRRIKDELGARLAYPDYRAGLKALLAAGA